MGPPAALYGLSGSLDHPCFSLPLEQSEPVFFSQIVSQKLFLSSINLIEKGGRQRTKPSK